MAPRDFPPATLNPRHEELRGEVRAFLADQLAARTSAERAQSWAGFDAGFSRRVGERGWIGMTWPRRYGGSERSALERYVVLEEMLAAGAPVSAHWIADRQTGPLILRFGTEQQREHFLPGIVRGELCFSVGLSEPDTGSDLASVRTRAVPDGDGWIVNGSKIWTTNGHRSQYMILFCRTGPVDSASRHAGFSQFIVDMSLPGIDVRPVLDLAGEHHINQIYFTDVRLDADAMIGTPGGGWNQVMAELANERSGPERFLSSFQLLVELSRVLGRDAPDAAAAAFGRLAGHIAVLRRMSLSVAEMLEAGLDPGTEAAVVKDLGAVIEQEIPEIARLLVALPPDVQGSDYQRVLAAVTLASPSFSLRGGAREILRGIIARGLDLR